MGGLEVGWVGGWVGWWVGLIGGWVLVGLQLFQIFMQHLVVEKP